MDIVNCPKCGKLFAKGSSPICDECVKKEEELFEIVRKFLDEFPNSSLNEVALATGVSAKKIMGYIKEGRIETSKGMSGDLRCAQCGRPIKRGRFCDKCVININISVNDMFTEKKKSVGMHTFKDVNEKK